MSAPEYPLPSVVGKPVPTWRLPTITVEDHTTPHGVIVSVTQRVPARVAEVHTHTERDKYGHETTRVTRRFESGLGGTGALSLMPERFTVIAPGGNAQVIHDAVERARSSFQPRGYRITQAMTPGATNAVVATCFGLVFCCMGAGMLGALIMAARPALSAQTPFRAGIVFIGAIFAVFMLIGLGVAAVSARRFWHLRTPPWVAEDQWLALRQALASATGADPASSRPVDVVWSATSSCTPPVPASSAAPRLMAAWAPPGRMRGTSPACAAPPWAAPSEEAWPSASSRWLSH